MIIYIDCETTGLNCNTDQIALFQYKVNDEHVRLIRSPNIHEIHDILRKAHTIVGHNLSFDLGFIGYFVESHQTIEDTLYLDRIVNYTEESHSLDDVAKRVLGRDVYEGLDKKRLQKTDWTSLNLTKEQLDYAKLDVEILPEILKHLKAKLPRGLQPIYNFDRKSILAGLRIQSFGLPVLNEEVYEELTRVEVEVNTLKASIAPLNANSPKQVTQALGIASSGDRVLADLEAGGNTLAATIRKVRGQIKYLNFLSKLDESDLFFGTLQPAARSGRFTSSKENLQNLPRDTKRFIGSKDRVIISADFAQLELRTIAAITGDTTMCELFRSGEDLHNYAAKTLFGDNFTKEQRQIAKVFNFSTLYGAGAATIGQILLTQTGIKLPEHQIQEYKRRWLRVFSGIAAWQREGSTRHALSIPWRTPHGRPYVSKMFTDHLSIENQGAGAEVARIALHYILEHLPEGAYLINFVHDSYLVEAPNLASIYKPACQVIYDGMKYAWDKAPFDKHGIEMPVDAAVAHNWKDADSLENCLYVMGDAV